MTGRHGHLTINQVAQNKWTNLKESTWTNDKDTCTKDEQPQRRAIGEDVATLMQSWLGMVRRLKEVPKP